MLATLLFLLEVLERRTGWVSRLFKRQPAAVRSDQEESQSASATPAQKPIFPWLVRKPQRKTPTPVTTKSTARPSDPVAPIQPAATPDKSAEPESAIDAMRKARERASRRTDKDR